MSQSLTSEMGVRINFVDCYESDVALCVLTFLDDPADVVRASAVSRSWRQFVISNCVSKKLCLRKVPAMSNIARVIEVNGETNKLVDGVFRDPINSDTLEREHRLYTSFLRAILNSMNNSEECLAYAVGASSTDRYPDHSITNVLFPPSQHPWGGSFWSSTGQRDPNTPEYLLFKFIHGISVVTEISLRPYEVFWEPGRPIFSAKSVRFRMGHPKSRSDMDIDFRYCPSKQPADKYEWTYTSPEFPMTQESSLQVYKLPQPAVCIGGFLLIELFGKVQREERDGLFYTRISHARFRVRPLQPEFDAEMEKSGELLLKYCPQVVDSLPQGLCEGRVPSVNPPESASWSEHPVWASIPVEIANELLDDE